MKLIAALLEPEFAITLARRHSLIPGVESSAADPTLSELAELVAVSAPIEPERRFVRGCLLRFEADGETDEVV